MTTVMERLWAAFDRTVHERLRMTRSANPFTSGTFKYYWSGWGRRCAIIELNGQVRHLGHSWAIRHFYNKTGVLVSRRPMALWAEPTDRVVYGREADKAWDAQPHKPPTGGLLFN